jgi:hydroxymethylbilane synthase
VGSDHAPAADGAVLRLATRHSPLARWQAEHVADLLRAAHPGLRVELVAMATEGDRRLDVPLSEIGGKGVFATEVQAALFDGRADLAVHSAKDLPAVTGDGLVLAAVPERGDPRDALVGARLEDLPTGAVVATGSARRRAQLAHLRPDLRFAELRGNMATRLAKADEFDAIVVAAVAFERLGLAEHLADLLDATQFVPQVAQAALAVECRSDDTATAAVLAAIEHAPSRRRVDAERAFLAELGGDCTLPAGAHAALADDGSLTLRAVLADEVGGRVVRDEVVLTDPSAPGAVEQVGRSLAAALRARLGDPS